MNPNKFAKPVVIKIEPEQPDLAERQERQHVVSQRSTNMENQQNGNQPNIDQPELILSHSMRDRLFNTLTRLSTILQCNKPIPKDAKERIGQKINEAVLLLMNLSPSFKPPESAAHSDVFEETISDWLTIDISRPERTKIIDQLISIKDALGSSITDEIRSSLIAGNGRIIVQLLNMQCKERYGRQICGRYEQHSEKRASIEEAKRRYSCCLRKLHPQSI